MDTVYTQEVGSDLDEYYSSERSRILVVEDDQDTAFLLKQILRHAGYDVLSAINGKEALNKVNLSFPDLVLLDLMMPEMDGWETVEHLRQVSNTPVIILTALNNKENVVTCFQRGVDDYMTKPFYKGEIVARVQAVLRRSRSTRDASRFVFPQVGLAIIRRHYPCQVQRVFLTSPRHDAGRGPLALGLPQSGREASRVATKFLRQVLV